MKTYNRRILLPLVILLIFSNLALSQDWHPPVPLVETGFDSYLPQIAVSDNMVHVVWMDYRNTAIGFAEIYYKRSSDYGLNWEPGIKLSNMPSGSGPGGPKIVLRDNFIHVIWGGYNFVNDKIYYCKSTDNGLNFSDPVILTHAPADILQPDIAVFEDNVHIVWSDDRSSPSSPIYYTQSTDNGNTWGPEKLLTAGGQMAYKPIVQAFGQNIFLSWNEQTNNPSEIFFMRSLDNGANWDAPLLLQNSSSIQTEHDMVATADHNLHMVWEDLRHGYFSELYYIRSSDAGANWTPEIRLTFSSIHSADPSIAAAGEKIRLSWTEYGEEQIYYMNSFNGGTDWSDPMRLSESSDLSIYPDVATFNDDVYVVWGQGVLLFQDIYFRRNLGYSSVEEGPGKDPNKAYLYQNYPNPFNGRTDISFYLPNQAEVLIDVYNSIGKKVSTMGNGQYPPGDHSIEWSAGMHEPGIYYYQIQILSGNSKNTALTRKMVLY